MREGHLGSSQAERDGRRDADADAWEVLFSASHIWCAYEMAWSGGMLRPSCDSAARNWLSVLSAWAGAVEAMAIAIAADSARDGRSMGAPF